MPYTFKYTAGRNGVMVERAAAALPQSTQGALFTITGGRILITELIGEVTTIIQTQADNTKIVSNPTVGGDIDLCAVLDITGDAVGTLYGITGTFANAMIGAGAAKPAQATAVVVPAGSLDLNCAASNTGAVKWKMWYMPLDPNVRVVAA